MDDRFEVTEEEIENLQNQGFTEEELEWLKGNKDTLSSGVLDAHINDHFTHIYNVAESMLSQQRRERLNSLNTPLLSSRNFPIVGIAQRKFFGIPLPQAHHTESDTGVMHPIHDERRSK